MKNVTMKVKGMHCGSCAMLIKESLEDTDGVESADVSYDKSSAKITFDKTKIDENKIKKIITKEGYKVE